MFRSSLLLASAAVLLCLSCTLSEDEACGKGTVYQDGLCHTASAGGPATAGSAASEGGNGEGGSGSGEGGSGTTVEPNFGASCLEHSDCSGATNYCAESPFAPAYCTASGCDDDASICPEGWSCFDVNQVMPGEPWVCAQPS